jgi:arginyl-tRNA synthetase
MKASLASLIQQAIASATAAGHLRPTDAPLSIVLEIPKATSHGDYSTNIAMNMARTQKTTPQEVARIITDHIDDPGQLLAKVEIAGPGFINFFIAQKRWYEILKAIHGTDQTYGTSQTGQGECVQVEFVSANPTGPLHVGHGRCAAVGETLSEILKAAGYKVQKEYYVNDSGRQIRTLGESVFVRYQQLMGRTVDLPEEGYQGDYISDLAETIFDTEGDRLLHIPQDQAINLCASFASKKILAEIREDLESFGVSFDVWFSEQSLYESGAVESVIAEGKLRGTIYEHEGALWFRTQQYGDEKDRVVVRANGLTTYFASDIAYHRDKFKRAFDHIINIWGADHHGYVSRVSASVQAFGFEAGRLKVLLIQLVNLLRAGRPVAMSTRAGEFVTLREVIEEVGRDAARFLFLLRHYESPLDFDLELAKKQSNENPVYYVQYVHARISNILKKAQEQNYTYIAWNETFPDSINLPEEIELIKLLARYPEVVTQSALLMEPHRIPFYLKELAGAFHAYYHDRRKHQVISENAELTMARLYLVDAIRIVIRNGLTLMGVSAPERM